MKVSTVVELDAKEVQAAVAEKARASLGKGGEQAGVGGSTIEYTMAEGGKIERAVVTFNGTGGGK